MCVQGEKRGPPIIYWCAFSEKNCFHVSVLKGGILSQLIRCICIPLQEANHPTQITLCRTEYSESTTIAIMHEGASKAQHNATFECI